MRPIVKWYLGLVSALGIVLGAGNVWLFFAQRAGTWSPASTLTFVSLLILSWGCSCLPLYVREDCTVDLSFISLLASALLLGPEGAITITLFIHFFVIIPSPDGKTMEHALNTAPYKTLFNLGNHIFSYAVGGIGYYMAGGMAGDIALPGALLPALLFIMLAVITNVLVILPYFVLALQIPAYPTAFQMFFGLLPSIGLSAPIGYFLALLLQMQGGVWLALLFMLPLLLARYSFKLYLHSQAHQRRIIQALAAALEAKDSYTEGHSQRVESYAIQVANRMGLRNASIKRLETAAIFHDIGKIGVPDFILQKPSFLTPEERAVIQKHPEQGVHILKNLDGYEEILPLVLHHHEFYNGCGYPTGTHEDEISLEAYILGAADAYDAITSDRPYRMGRSSLDAAAILRAEAGKQFHPEVARVLAEMAEAGELQRPVLPDVFEKGA